MLDNTSMMCYYSNMQNINDVQHTISVARMEVNTTDNELTWRVSISLTKEQEEAILKLRQMDEFRRCSFAEIVRMLIDIGLKTSELCATNDCK